jgi:cell division protein ZapE
VIISAQVPPDEIYAGSDHGFEFTRTVSRLLEMQSRDYP